MMLANRSYFRPLLSVYFNRHVDFNDVLVIITWPKYKFENHKYILKNLINMLDLTY